MEKTISPAKSGLPYGIVFGVIMILEFVTMHILKPDPLESGWIGTVMNLLNYLILPVLFISLACNNFKNKLNNGYITIGQSIKAGVALCALAGLIYAIAYFVYSLLFPEFIAEMLDQIKAVTVEQNPNMTAEQLKMSISIVEKTMQPYIAGPIAIVMYSFLGLIYSLIIGAIVKKENPGAIN
jgi:hypothetical protein